MPNAACDISKDSCAFCLKSRSSRREVSPIDIQRFDETCAGLSGESIMISRRRVKKSHDESVNEAEIPFSCRSLHGAVK